MAKNEIVPQYYNLYDETKGYTELLFRAGKILQSKELNELQSTIKNQIKNVGNTVLTNGDIIEGCQLIVADNRKSVTITKGRIYLDGDVREVPVTTIAITGTGTEVIGVILKSQVVTPDEDSELNDVATGYDNYNQDGAYRLQEFVEITLDNPDASILYTLVNGEQLSLNKNEDLTQLEKIQNTLARRTFDESGNYKVSGLTLSDKNQSDENHIYVSLEQGKAYVRGYEVQRDTAYTVLLDKATDLRDAENEPKTFRSTASRYTLNNNYVSNIKKLVGIVEVTQNITRGGIIGGIDPLPLKPVVEIDSITQGTKTYINGTDFQLTQDGVDWSVGSDSPDPGASYSCTWTYNKTMVKDVDYKLTISDDTTLGYIDFLSGDKPVHGSTFLVNYDYMLARIDVVSLDMRGNVIVTKGQSDILRTVTVPNVDSNEVLPIGSVLLTPMSNTPQITNNNTKSITMLDLYNLLQRVNTIEYNQAISDLDQEAASGESATDLKGIFTDGFVGTSKLDLYHPDFKASIDETTQELSTFAQATPNKLTVTSASNPTIQIYKKLLTIKGTEVAIINQTKATGVFRVNSYNAFPKNPIVVPTPSNWPFTESGTPEESHDSSQDKTDSRVTNFTTWTQANNWAKSQNITLTQTASYNATYKVKTTGTTYNRFDAIEYMQQRSIVLDIDNLEPMVDNIIVMFDNQQIGVSGTSSEFQGTIEGTLKANGSGKSQGQFQVPANTKCGTVEIKVYARSTPNLVGIANYTSTGQRIVAVTPVWYTTKKIHITDPVAQSFQFETDQYITGVGLYFNAKNDSNDPITVQLTDMVNGYPGTTIYESKVLQSSDVKISDNATLETRVTFDNPVYCRANEGYCVTVISSNDIDSVWIAETNKPRIDNGEVVSEDTFNSGVMFSSSNNMTWTAHQSQDLTFHLYTLAQTNSSNVTGTVTFDKITGINYDRIKLSSVESIPSGCSIQWQFSVNDGAFLPIESGITRDLDEVAETLQFKAILQGTLTNVPFINLDGLIVTGYQNDNEGAYVSRNINVEDGFNNIKVIVDMSLPTGSNTVLYYSTDASGTDWHALTNVGSVQKTVDYKTYTFENTLTEPANNYRVKIAMMTNDPINRPKIQKLRSILKTI